MPVVRGEKSGITFPKLEAREWRNTVGQSGMTPTAFAFLIPVFVVVVFFPFLCIFFIRKRRRTPPVVSTRPKKPPALRRAEARERLNSVTEESRVANIQKAAHNAPSTEAKEVAPSNTSISEQECAICLSTLHAPSPPEPVALTTQPTPSDPAAHPPSPSINATTTITPEAILKLNTCGHEFHAECLVSWVVLRKTSCPICRSIYITKEQMTQYDEEAEIASESLAAADAEMANTNVAPVRNWRYFLYGNALWGRQQQQPVGAGAPAFNMTRT